MLLEPNERSKSIDVQKTRLVDLMSRKNSNLFLAVSSDELVGFLQARGGEYNRNKIILKGLLETNSPKPKLKFFYFTFF